MEVCSDWEVYIPVEAEVKNIPLKSLPKSVLRRIGLPVSDSDSSRKPSHSSDVTWICPAVIGKKGKGSALRKRRHEAGNVLEFLGTEFQAGPLKMSFVSSNRAARDVLKNLSPGKSSSKEELLCQDSAPPANQNAVVVYDGQIYLCIRKARRKQQKSGKLQPLSQAAIPSTSGQAKELIGGSQKIKADAAKVKRCEKAELKRKRSSSVRAEYSAPRLSDSGHRADLNSPYVKAARKQSASEETALQPSSIQPQEEQKNPTNNGSGEYEKNNSDQEDCSVWTDNMSQNQMDGQDDSSHGWTRAESLGAAAASTSKLMDFDFNELEQEEKIAQLKARFLQNEAALKNLLS